MSEANQARATKAGRASESSREGLAAETLLADMPSSFTDLFDKSLARAKDAHEKMTTILEYSTGALEEAFSCANRGSAEYRGKLMEIARTTTDMAFDAARDAFEVKSLPELFELAVAHQRKQCELAAAQMKDLSALTQRVVSETTQPIRDGIAEPFRMAS
jgi:hypothetical protein